jgi:uncharacterized protein YegP (UPF0339 family)
VVKGSGLWKAQEDDAVHFEIYRDNGSQFHWRLVGDDGAKLAVSATTFGSAEDARRAAGDVHLNAGSADGTEASG